MFEGEVDRIYLAPPALGVEDAGRGALLRVDQTGLPDAVVWNPWIAKSKTMADMGEEARAPPTRAHTLHRMR